MSDPIKNFFWQKYRPSTGTSDLNSEVPQIGRLTVPVSDPITNFFGKNIVLVQVPPIYVFGGTPNRKAHNSCVGPDYKLFQQKISS